MTTPVGTTRSRAFEPVAGAVLGELDGLVRQRLDPERVEELKASLRELTALDKPQATTR